MSMVKPLSVWLTREELQTVWAYQWVAHIYPAYGAEHMSDAERENLFLESLGEALRWSIRELIAQGFEFEAIAMQPDGTLYLTQEEVLCPENVILLGKLARGKQLNPIAAISTALMEFEKRGLAIDRGPLVDVLIQAKKDSDEARRLVEEDEELVAAMDKAFKLALGAAGFVATTDKEKLN